MARTNYIHFNYVDPTELQEAFNEVCRDKGLDPAKARQEATSRPGKSISLENLAHLAISLGGGLTITKDRGEVTYE